MQTQPERQSVYVLSQGANFAALLTAYTNTISAQRFDCLWIVGDLVKKRQEQGDLNVRQYIKNNTDKYFFVNIIADDFNKYKPDLVFVDVKKINIWLGGIYTHFDFLNYFKENPQFQKEWNSYEYVTTLSGNEKQYQFDVYKRRMIYD